jgi:hypothetical protein
MEVLGEARRGAEGRGGQKAFAEQNNFKRKTNDDRLS